MNFLQATRQAAVAGRWIALVAGTLLTAVFLLFVFGEGPPPLWRLSLNENLSFLAMLALSTGMVLAWKWEGWGAAVTLAGYVLLRCVDRRFSGTLAILLPAAVGLLHLLCWFRLKAVK
jgi:hypothetical protein